MQYQLTNPDREILDTLAAMPSLTEQASSNTLHARFGDLTRLWQYVNALIDHETALAYQPALVARLRRTRDRRARRGRPHAA